MPLQAPGSTSPWDTSPTPRGEAAAHGTSHHVSTRLTTSHGSHASHLASPQGGLAGAPFPADFGKVRACLRREERKEEVQSQDSGLFPAGFALVSVSPALRTNTSHHHRHQTPPRSATF